MSDTGLCLLAGANIYREMITGKFISNFAEKIFMKLSSIFILLLVAVTTKAQPRLSKDTLFVDSTAFVKGQDIYIGTGSNAATKGFNYLFTSPGLSMPVPLSAQWTGYKMIIKNFKTKGNKTMGTKYYLVLSAGEIINYWCDVVPALQSKEIILKQNEYSKTQ